MRIRKEPQPVEITCIDCGEVFIAYSKKAKRCPVCRKIKQREQSKNCMEFMRGYKKPQENKYNHKPKMTIREVLKELAKYNKENGAHLSYGQFVLILEKGQA